MGEDDIIADARIFSSENHYKGGLTVRFEFSRERLLMFARAIEQASRRAAMEECWEAVHTERLVDPTDSADDIAYQNAVEHCQHAIRALSKDDKS